MLVQNQEKAISNIYNTLERLAYNVLDTYESTCFAELPDSAKNFLLSEQSRLFNLHQVCREDYLGDSEFIAID